ncbi:MAG: hypothetical protein M5U27_01740 [Gaiella sp.]|nr:hypothetical protein [Gaiella sp.]
MPPDARLGRKLVVAGELHATGGARNGGEPARHDRDVVRPLTLEGAELRSGVRVERPVTVEVVGLDVREDGDPRSQRVDVLELERRQLADDPRLVGDFAGQRGERSADVPRHLHVPSRRFEDRAQQRRRRRLPVRPGDADQRVRQEACAELDLRDHGNAACARGRHRLRRGRHAGTLDDE